MVTLTPIDDKNKVGSFSLSKMQPAPQQGPPLSAKTPPEQPGYLGAADKWATEQLPGWQPSSILQSDIVQSAGAGVRQGIEGIGGAMGDASQSSGDVASWLAQKLGASPDTAGTIGSVATHLNPWGGMMPSTKDVQGLTDSVAGPAYQPQTTPGDYARTVGQFAPNALLGPGGLVRKTAMTVIPAFASETAGQLTKGTAAEPYARGATALLAAVASAGRNVNPASSTMPAARTAEDLASEAGALYKQADQAGISIKAPAATKLSQNIEFAAGRLNDKLRPNTQGIVEDARALAGQDLSLQQLDEFRQTIGQAMQRAQPQDARTLGQIKKVVDNFADNANPADINGDIKGFDLIKQARDVWAKKSKVDVLNQVVERAKNQAAGFENGIVTQMRLLANNPDSMSQFTKSEQAMINGVVRRGSAHGILRAIGMMAPNSTFGGLANLGVAGASGLLPGAITAGMGAAAKYGAGALTKSKLSQLQRAASTGVAPPTGPAPLNIEALIRTLLAAKTGDNSAQTNTAIGQPNR